MPAGPLLLISKSVRALLPFWHGPLGQLFTPRLLAGLDITEGCGIRWAAVILSWPASRSSEQRRCVEDGVFDASG